MKPTHRFISVVFCGLLAAAATSALAAEVDKRDAKALRDLGEANLAEVETGKLAVSKARSEEVKKFAQHMVDDHGKQLQDLQKLAAAKGVELPAAPARKHQAAMKKLQTTEGENFDRAYMAQMVKDHREALKLAQTTARRGKDPEVKAAAEKAAPDIKEHLQMAQQLAGGKSASTGSSRRAASPDASAK
jgi:putative membrane protein